METDFCMAKVKFLLPFNMPLYFFLYPLEQFKNEIKMPQGSQVVNDLLLLLTLHFSFNMCITALQNDRRDGLYIPCTKQRIFQKMFIYMLFYIDLTVQLDRTIERLMLQKLVRFLLLVALIACYVYLGN